MLDLDLKIPSGVRVGDRVPCGRYWTTTIDLTTFDTSCCTMGRSLKNYYNRCALMDMSVHR